MAKNPSIEAIVKKLSKFPVSAFRVHIPRLSRGVTAAEFADGVENFRFYGFPDTFILVDGSYRFELKGEKRHVEQGYSGRPGLNGHTTSAHYDYDFMLCVYTVNSQDMVYNHREYYTVDDNYKNARKPPAGPLERLHTDITDLFKAELDRSKKQKEKKLESAKSRFTDYLKK